jgi:ribosomal protein S18
MQKSKLPITLFYFLLFTFYFLRNKSTFFAIQKADYTPILKHYVAETGKICSKK